MAEEEVKKVETQEVPVTETAPPIPEAAETPAATPPPVEEKSVVPHVEDKVDDTKALAVVDKVPEATEEKKKSGGSIDRDVALTRVETEKRLSLISAWEDSEKTKAQNKAERKKATIEAWENTKIADIEAQLKKIEEDLERKKAGYAEKMKNKIAMFKKEAEEKKAEVIAKRGEELLQAEETAAKFRATNKAPKKLIGCFGY